MDDPRLVYNGYGPSVSVSVTVQDDGVVVVVAVVELELAGSGSLSFVQAATRGIINPVIPTLFKNSFLSMLFLI
jgi:hypothetical protein